MQPVQPVQLAWALRPGPWALGTGTLSSHGRGRGEVIAGGAWPGGVGWAGMRWAGVGRDGVGRGVPSLSEVYGHVCRLG